MFGPCGQMDKALVLCGLHGLIETRIAGSSPARVRCAGMCASPLCGACVCAPPDARVQVWRAGSGDRLCSWVWRGGWVCARTGGVCAKGAAERVHHTGWVSCAPTPYRTPHHHHPAATPMSAQHASGCCHPPCTHACVCQLRGCGAHGVRPSGGCGCGAPPFTPLPHPLTHTLHATPPRPPPIACARVLAPPGRRRGCTAQECRQYECGCQRSPCAPAA